MTLSETERLVLINQFEILKRLDEGDARFYDERIEILTDGYEIFYSSLGTIAEPMPANESRLVMSVLDMYRAIDDYINDHPDDVEVARHGWASFKGFDGNNEGHYMAFARFLIKVQGKWSEQAARAKETDGYNSHWPCVPQYTAMVEAWGGPSGARLSREHVLRILSAAN